MEPIRIIFSIIQVVSNYCNSISVMRIRTLSDPVIFACRIRYFFHRIRILPVTTDTYISISIFIYIFVFIFIFLRYAYLRYKYFFIIFELRSDPGKKFPDPHLCSINWNSSFHFHYLRASLGPHRQAKHRREISQKYHAEEKFESQSGGRGRMIEIHNINTFSWDF